MRDVVVVGAPFYDTHGTVQGLQGFYLDLTPGRATLDGNGHRDGAAHQLQALVAGWGHSDERRERVRAATRC